MTEMLKPEFGRYTIPNTGREAPIRYGRTEKGVCFVEVDHADPQDKVGLDEIGYLVTYPDLESAQSAAKSLQASLKSVSGVTEAPAKHRLWKPKAWEQLDQVIVVIEAWVEQQRAAGATVAMRSPND